MKKRKREIVCPFCKTALATFPLRCPNCAAEIGHLVDSRGVVDRNAVVLYEKAHRALHRSTLTVTLVWAAIWGAIYFLLVQGR